MLPLHNPIRVAEDWAVVDNLSGGRVGLSFASGWHVNDFALMPQNFDVAGLSRIEMYAGAKPDAKVVLEREANGTKWKVASKFGAPASQDKMDEYLKILKGLKGEFRAQASGDALKDYSLDDEGGFHVLGYAAGSDAPAKRMALTTGSQRRSTK